MIGKKHKILNMGDIHLNHPRTNYQRTLNGLYRAVPNAPSTAELDMVIIPGDLFDNTVLFPEDSIGPIQKWMMTLLKTCVDCDVQLRVLEGTPQHDRTQSRVFLTLNEHIGADLKYFGDLDIEHNSRIGTVLYVPDEYRHTTDEIWKAVTARLRAEGLESVDYAVMHGMWGHQTPPVAHIDHHRIERYRGIVNHVVFSGHIHTPSVLDKFVCSGSFDRLTHGEEHRKGWYVMTNDRGTVTTEFFENSLATIYRTLNVTGMELPKVIELLDTVPDEPSNYRLECEPLDDANLAVRSLMAKYPEHRITMKLPKTVRGSESIGVSMKIETVTVELTPTNLPELVVEQMETRNTPLHLREHILKLLERTPWTSRDSSVER